MCTLPLSLAKGGSEMQRVQNLNNNLR